MSRLHSMFFSLFVAYEVNLSRSSYLQVNLPDNHMPFYYRHFPEELKKCLDDEGCPYKVGNNFGT